MASKFFFGVFFATTVVILAACSPLGNIAGRIAQPDSGAEPASVGRRQAIGRAGVGSGVGVAETPEPSANAAPGIGTGAPTPSPVASTPPPEPTPEPTATPYPCPVGDGSVPQLWGEFVPPTTKGGLGREIRLTTACWGRFDKEVPQHSGGTKKITYDLDSPVVGSPAAIGDVDNRLLVLVAKLPAYATFRLRATSGDRLEFELWRRYGPPMDSPVAPTLQPPPGEEPPDDSIRWRMDCNGWCRGPFFSAWIGALPGKPSSPGGDAVGVYPGAFSYARRRNQNPGWFLSPDAEARWGAGKVHFPCAADQEFGESVPAYQYTEVLEPTPVYGSLAVGERFALQTASGWHKKLFYQYYPEVTIVVKDGGCKFLAEQVFGVTNTSNPDALGAQDYYGLDLPVWSTQLRAFVRRADETQETGWKGFLQVVTEDDIEAILEK